MINANKGLFITFEGTDGSGKTSVLKEVIARLSSEGYKVESTREPGGNKIAELIRNIILDKANTDMDPKTEALLYAAARRQHLVQNVLPLLNKGITVISDRYIDSSLAYQGYARKIGIDEVLSINMFAIDNKMPDLTLLFRLDPEIGIKRISSDSEREVNRLDVEKMSFHKKAFEGYDILAKRFKDRFVVIDASKSLKSVVEEAYKAVKTFIDASNKSN